MAVKQIRLIIGGKNGGGNDWSIGFSLQGDTTVDSAALGTWLASIQGAISAAWNTGGAGFGALASSSTQLQYISAYAYNVAGGGATAQNTYTYATPVGGAGSRNAPYYVSCCVSLRSALPGRKNRGRVYCPADGISMTLNQFTSAQITSVCNGIKAVIQALVSSTLGTGPVSVVVAGPNQTVPPLVYQVTADSLPDVQHRRQDKVAAIATVQVAVPTGG